MRASKVLLFLASVLLSILCLQAFPLPDSAGIVEMPPGAAYGGIPYGSVTGMVADYYNGRSLYPDRQQPIQPVYY